MGTDPRDLDELHGMCAKGKVTVCLDPKTGEPAEVLVVDPIDEKHELYDTIVEKLGKHES